jgi:hypothetical protein
MKVIPRTVAILLVSICLSVAIGLAMLITALAPAAVAASPGGGCAVPAVWSPYQLTGSMCPVTVSSPKCCTRSFLG